MRVRDEALKHAVETLPTKYRVPLVLRVEGHSYARIAEAILSPEGTAKSRVCRGKLILRKKLRRYL